MTYRFWVGGMPKAQPRTKAVAIAGHARVYTPKSADAWKATVAIEAKRHIPTPLEGPVWLHCTFLFPRPQRLLTKKSPALALPHTGPPDRDNLDKAVLDALTGIAFGDDRQVCYGTVIKAYVAKGYPPGVQISCGDYLPGECEWTLKYGKDNDND